MYVALNRRSKDMSLQPHVVLHVISEFNLRYWFNKGNYDRFVVGKNIHSFHIMKKKHFKRYLNKHENERKDSFIRDMFLRSN